MSHETTSVEEKPASGGCCGGMDKDKAAKPTVAEPDAKPAADTKHEDHKKTSGFCC